MTKETLEAYASEFIVRDMLELTRVNVHGVTVEIPVERKFANLESIQTYVDKVLELNWVMETYKPRPLMVMRNKAINQADCGGGIMRVNPDHNRWALREIVILHEIAHHLTRAPLEDSHGVAFRTCFAHLVEEIIGSEVAWLLRTTFWDHGLTVYNSPEKV